MKIGIVLNNTPSYSETFFNSKISGLQKQGHEVILFTNKPGTSYSSLTISQKIISKVLFIRITQTLYYITIGICKKPLKTLKFFKLSISNGMNLYQTSRLYILNFHILHYQKIDWLHFGFLTLCIDREFIAHVLGCPMTASIRGYDIGIYPLKNPNCYELTWKFLDKVHVLSKDLLIKAQLNGLKSKTPFTIIPPAINEIYIEYNKEIKPVNIKNKILQITTTGRLNWKKNYVAVFNVLNKLKKQNISFKYNIIGVGNSTENERLKYLMYELNLSENIVFHGQLKALEILEILNSTDIYIQYSLQEGFCNSLLEAQALGLLCIASNADGLNENIINNKTGWIVNKHDESDLLIQINKILDLSPKDQVKIRLKAKERVKKEFNLIIQQERFKDFFKIPD